MANLAGLVGIVAELRTERTNLVSQLRQVDVALSALGSLNGNSAPTKGIVSAEARRKMSLAQKARWAKSAPTTKTAPATVKPKKVMSAPARRKIAAAQRARWAKIRAQKAA
jgi:hypothetical protein